MVDRRESRNLGGGETEDEEGSSDDHNESDETLDRKRRALKAINEDMDKLEEIFEEKGMKYKLISRIGEGSYRSSAFASQAF